MSSKLHPSYPSTKKGGLVTRIFGLALSSFAALGVAFFVNAGESAKMVSAAAEPLAVDTVTAPDFSKETEADSSSLTFTLAASSLTDSMNSFRVTVRSGSVSTVRSTQNNNYDTIYLVVVSEGWTTWSEETTNGTAAYNAATEAGEEYTPTAYDAYVYNIDAGNCNADVVIPEQVRGPTVGTSNCFVINVIGIYADACATYSTVGEKGDISYTSRTGSAISSITIPDSVTTIESGAFPNASSITFNVETETAPAGWADDWTDGSINYGSEYSPSPSTKGHPVGQNGTKSFGVAHDYAVGSVLDLEGYEDYYQPLWITYNVVDSQGNVVKENQTMQQPVTNTTLQCDAVGSNVGGGSMTMNVDFPVEAGTHVDPESIRFHNIYDALTSQIGGRSYTHPVVGEGHGPYYVVPNVSFSQNINISDLFTFESGNSVSFGEHVSFSIKMKLDNLATYQKVCPTQYASFRNRISSGILNVRVLFNSLELARYRFVYEHNGEEITKTLQVTTPIDYTILENGMTFSFLVKASDVGEGFSYSSLKELYFENFNVKVDLFDYEDNAVETGSALTTRFGSMSLLPAGKEAVGTVDLINIMMWVYIIFIIVAVIVATVIYVYRKNKFKNDEFRRVNGKKYFLETLKKVLGSFLILSSLMFITFRWGFLNNSITVYNPVDIWVIIFTVAGAIALGLFIKDAVVGIRLSNERKRKERLHIDDDVVDDGTK